MNRSIHPEIVVDTQWLNDHLHNPQVRIVEVDMSPKPYKNAHLPGAVFWDIMIDLFQPDLRLRLEPEVVEALLSKSGITHETTVVAYGSYPGTGAWIFWFLKAIGHPDVRVLNGGHQKWLAEGRPVTSDLSTFAPTPYHAQPADPTLRVTQAEVEAAIAQPDKVLVDVRSLAEYRGEVFLTKPPTGAERAGHIPGAVHIEHTLTLNDDGTFKSLDELQALFSGKGVTPDKEVFPYCAVGGRSAYMWFVLKYLLGYPNVRNYDRSWNEWGRLPNVAITT